MYPTHKCAKSIKAQRKTDILNSQSEIREEKWPKWHCSLKDGRISQNIKVSGFILIAKKKNTLENLKTVSIKQM